MLNSTNTMAGAVDKVVGIASCGNDIACHIINLTTFDAFTCRELLTYKSDCRITSVTYNIEDFALVGGNLVACSGEGDPGIVGIDGIGHGETAPEVKEYQITAPDRTGLCVRGTVMWIPAIGIHSHYWSFSFGHN